MHPFNVERLAKRQAWRNPGANLHLRRSGQADFRWPESPVL